MFQRDAYISVDFANHEITIVKQDDKDETSIIPGMGINQLCFTKTDALDDELKSFIHAVTKRQAPEVSGHVGRSALKVALGIMEQIKNRNNRYFS